MQKYARRRPRKKCTKKLPSGECTENDPAKNSIETVNAKDCKGGIPWEKAQGKNRAKDRTQNGSAEKCTGATLKKHTEKTIAKERTEMCPAKKRTQKVQGDEPMDISAAKDCTVKHAPRRAEKSPPPPAKKTHGKTTYEKVHEKNPYKIQQIKCSSERAQEKKPLQKSLGKNSAIKRTERGTANFCSQIAPTKELMDISIAEKCRIKAPHERVYRKSPRDVAHRNLPSKKAHGESPENIALKNIRRQRALKTTLRTIIGNRPCKREHKRCPCEKPTGKSLQRRVRKKLSENGREKNPCKKARCKNFCERACRKSHCEEAHRKSCWV